MIKKSAHFVYNVFFTTIKRFFTEDYTTRASSLAYTTLLTLVPLILVIVSFGALFPDFNQIIVLGENYIIQNFVPQSAIVIESYFVGFLNQATHLSTFSIIFLFLVTIVLVHIIEETLNDIWRVPRRIRSKKIVALLFYWIVFLLVPFVIGFSIFISSYLFFFNWIVNQASLSTYLLPILINTIIFSLFYTIVPNVTVRWSEGFLGGFITALLFELARLAFAFYISQFASYSLIYGAFAAVPIFLLWLYVFWAIILFGALFTNSWVDTKHKITFHKV